MGDEDEEDGGLDLGLGGDQVQEQQQRAEEAREQEGQSETDIETQTESSDSTGGTTEQTVDEAEDTQSESTETVKKNETSSEGESPSQEKLPGVKERQDRIQAYVPPSFFNDWELAVTQVTLTWQQHGDGRSIEKLRHIYPILLKVGTENVDELTADEIGRYMDEIEEEDRETL